MQIPVSHRMGQGLEIPWLKLRSARRHWGPDEVPVVPVPEGTSQLQAVNSIHRTEAVVQWTPIHDASTSLSGYVVTSLLVIRYDTATMKSKQLRSYVFVIVQFACLIAIALTGPLIARNPLWLALEGCLLYTSSVQLLDPGPERAFLLGEAL